MKQGSKALYALVMAGCLALASAAGQGSAVADSPSDFSRDDIVRTIRDLTEMAPRATGSPGGLRAAEYVADRYRAAGLTDVHFEEATSYDWTASGAGLSIAGTEIEANPVNHSLIPADAGPGRRSTGPDGLTAEVVDIGTGSVDGIDVNGKIVLFDLDFLLPTVGLLPFAEYIYDPDDARFDPDTLLAPNPFVTSLDSTVRAAQAAGAVGFVGVLAEYFDSNRYHNEYSRRLAMTIPGMWVTRADGANMREMLPGAGNQVRIDLTTDRRAVTARTVVGVLPGRTNDTLMVQSHHDSVGPGAVEDASGTSEVIALADYYGAAAREPGYVPREKSLMFVTFDTHFTGYQGHMAFIEKYVTQRATPWNIVANATIEHVGKHARIAENGELITLEQPEPKGVFENLNLGLKFEVADMLRRNDVRATTMLNGSLPQALLGGIPTDASFILMAGVPTVSFIAGPLYLYDDADTLDKVDTAQLEPVARFYRDVLDRLDREPSATIGLMPATVR
ncbi:MAG: M28 family peptidase [Rhodococcus sp. (in: high G+C Gram-positive bacteria)]